MIKIRNFKITCYSRGRGSFRQGLHLHKTSKVLTFEWLTFDVGYVAATTALKSNETWGDRGITRGERPRNPRGNKIQDGSYEPLATFPKSTPVLSLTLAASTCSFSLSPPRSARVVFFPHFFFHSSWELSELGTGLIINFVMQSSIMEVIALARASVAARLYIYARGAEKCACMVYACQRGLLVCPFDILGSKKLLRKRIIFYFPSWPVIFCA